MSILFKIILGNSLYTYLIFGMTNLQYDIRISKKSLIVTMTDNVRLGGDKSIRFLFVSN